MTRMLNHTIALLALFPVAWLRAAEPELPGATIRESQPQGVRQEGRKAERRIRLNDVSEVRFASRKEGKAILGMRDEFVMAQSSMDRAVRLKSAKPVTVETYLEFVTSEVLEWEAQERSRVEDAMTTIVEKLKPLGLPWPHEILLIKTSGKEEGQAAYTRANGVVLPQKIIASPEKKLKELLSHELFHVLSRSNPELQAKLYRALGFEKCNAIELPESSKLLRLTNPDAPRNDQCKQVTVDGKKVWALPILFTRSLTYDEKRGGELFDYLECRHLLLDRQSGESAAKPLLKDGELQFMGPKSVFHLHPEEVAAYHFTIVVLLNDDDIRRRCPSDMANEVLRFKQVLTEHRQGS